LADLAELAEKAGWDAILLEDYIVYNLADFAEYRATTITARRC
jgi:hypothetical protein